MMILQIRPCTLASPHYQQVITEIAWRRGDFEQISNTVAT
jgi:hypothetical protein